MRIKGKSGFPLSEVTKKKIGDANRRPVSFTCDYCEKKSITKPSAYKKKNRHFCSSACYANYRRFHLPIEEHNRYGTGFDCKEKQKRKQCRSILNHAIRDGKIKREQCKIAGCLELAEAHHDDYDKPLDIKWFCFGHHRKYHKTIYDTPELLKES